MSHYINSLLKAEITCIPGILDKYVGNYYNNKISNGATWLLLLWYVLHFTFTTSIRALLKRMSFKSYTNNRFNRALWYLGFYAVVFVYCCASLFQNDFRDLYRLILPIQSGNLTGNYLLGFIIILTFYVQSAFWEGLKNEDMLTALNYLLLSIVMLYGYFVRSIEIAFVLTVLISSVHFVTEFCRIIQIISNYESEANKMLTKAIFGLSLLLSVLVYCLILPLKLLVPFCFTLIQNPSLRIIGLITSLLLWLATEILLSPCFRLAKHWIYHDEFELNSSCPQCFVECSLFYHRDDEVYIMKLHRKEMKERTEKLIALRKPKNRGMLIQTLKCMVAIKRKINEKRLSESSESDDSDKSETDNDLSEKQEESFHSGSDDDLEDELDNQHPHEEIVNGKLQIRVSESKEILNESEEGQ